MMTTVPPMTASAPVPRPIVRSTAAPRPGSAGWRRGWRRAHCRRRRLLPQPTCPVDQLVRASPPVSVVHLGCHGATFTPNAVARMLIRNSAMNANTTVSLTALPTAVGPPPTESPL